MTLPPKHRVSQTSTYPSNRNTVLFNYFLEDLETLQLQVASF